MIDELFDIINRNIGSKYTGYFDKLPILKEFNNDRIEIKRQENRREIIIDGNSIGYIIYNDPNMGIGLEIYIELDGSRRNFKNCIVEYSDKDELLITLQRIILKYFI